MSYQITFSKTYLPSKKTLSIYDNHETAVTRVIQAKLTQLVLCVYSKYCPYLLLPIIKLYLLLLSLHSGDITNPVITLSIILLSLLQYIIIMSLSSCIMCVPNTQLIQIFVATSNSFSVFLPVVDILQSFSVSYSTFLSLF